ncbi:hypothetical protein [Pseudaminobacter sp. NGMCC 1.201702]|uniref:hypothetical protein n=1 Tax=Pseudaminobacter sp. NGMCC 1.201702 TaxID=3391825 RepID=UPI0039F0E8DE
MATGLPDYGINGLMHAFRTRQHRLPFLQVRPEKSAAFMAAYDKWIGQLGVRLTGPAERSC